MKEFRGKINVLKHRAGYGIKGVALMAIVVACLAPPYQVVYASSQNPPTSQTTSVTPEGLLQMAQTNPAGAAQQLAQASGINLGDASGIINGLLQNPSQAATALLGSVLAKQLSGPFAKILSGIPGFGNLNLGQLTEALSKTGAGAALGELLKNLPAGDVLKQAMQAFNLNGLNLEGMAKQLGAQMVADLIAKAFPDLAKLLGGIPGLTELLNSLFGMGGGGTDPNPGGASCNCEGDIKQHHVTIRQHMSNKRKEHETWLVTEFFTKHVAPALMLMAEQLTAAGMQQVQIIGSFFDAKHQLETQRLMQQMTAQAHKDYQPSEGLCTFGTSVRSLAGSDRAADLAQVAIAARGMQRQLLNGENLSAKNPLQGTDRASRMKTFIDKFCEKKDNNETLDELCEGSSATAEQKNKDIDYTRAIENKLTLDMDFHTSGHKNPSDDEISVFALGANLYAHDVFPYVDKNNLGPRGQDKRFDSEQYIMDLRALAAKRSVAQNSFAAITAMRAAGTPEAQPYLYKMVEELGVPEDDLEKLLGKNPSYFAQMEILTKKALQNPVFYTELYDKPVNVDRKAATLQAVGLMQDRDIYKSLIRSEAILSVLLDSMLA